MFTHLFLCIILLKIFLTFFFSFGGCCRRHNKQGVVHSFIFYEGGLSEKLSIWGLKLPSNTQ